MGEPTTMRVVVFITEGNLKEIGNKGERRELKHLSTYRKRNQIEIL